MHLPQSLQLHRINGFARFFHGFLSARLLHSGHTSKLPFFHCFSNVSRVLYVTWHHFTLSSLFHRFSSRCNQFSKRSTQNFHCFPILFPLFYVIFPHFFIVYPIFYAINLSFHFINFHSVLPWCYSISPVCLTLTQMHLPQSRINGFARFFHVFFLCFWSHIETAIFPLLFHCFTRALRDNGPTSEPQFYLASFYPLPILFTVFPRVLINFPSVLLTFSIAFPFFSIVLCHSPSFFPLFFSSFSPPFPFFPIVLCHIPSFFPLFFSSFSPPLQSPQVHLRGRTRGELIPHRHPIATWYITLKKFTCGHLFYHLIS